MKFGHWIWRTLKNCQYIPNVWYFFVTVDCLSRYLRVELMKTKYATEAAEAFKNDQKQTTKIGVF